MIKAIEGGCRCGQVRYRLRLEQLPKVYACHCRDCQTGSGSAFSLNFFLTEERLEMTGRTAVHERGSAGEAYVQHACPVCSARLFDTIDALPGVLMMRAGTLDRSDELVIAAHIWAKRKLAGIEIPAGVHMARASAGRRVRRPDDGSSLKRQVGWTRAWRDSRGERARAGWSFA